MDDDLASLIAEKGITMKFIKKAPPMIRPTSRYYRNVPGYTVTLKYGEKSTKFYFYQGFEEPDVEGVLSYALIRSDALKFAFKDYCREFEYYAGKRAARKYYEDREIGRRLKAFLGDDFDRFYASNDY